MNQGLRFAEASWQMEQSTLWDTEALSFLWQSFAARTVENWIYSKTSHIYSQCFYEHL